MYIVNKEGTNIRLSWLRIIYFVLIILFVIFLVNQFPGLDKGLHQLKLSKTPYYLLVFGFSIASFFMAALSYYFLSFKKLKYFRTVIMQFASNAINKILPAGIGAIGSNYLYLKNNGSSALAAGASVLVNNVLGVLASITLFIVFVGFNLSHNFKFSKIALIYILIASLFIIIVVLSVLSIHRIRSKFLIFIKKFINQLLVYKKYKRKIFYAFLSQLMLALFNILALYVSLRSIDSNLSLVAIMVSYSFAIWIGTLIPAPGGLGSVDAGLVSALLAYGITLPYALAGVLIFRLINFFSPLLIGIPALIYVRYKKYIN